MGATGDEVIVHGASPQRDRKKAIRRKYGKGKARLPYEFLLHERKTGAILSAAQISSFDVMARKGSPAGPTQRPLPPKQPEGLLIFTGIKFLMGLLLELFLAWRARRRLNDSSPMLLTSRAGRRRITTNGDLQS